MTKREKLIVSAYTGILMTKFDEFHEFAEKTLGRPIQSYEFAMQTTCDELKNLVTDEFLNLCAIDTAP